MKMKFIYTVLSFLLLLILMWGCSPSSNALRYAKEQHTLEEDRDSVVRFTSIDNWIEEDSLCCGEEEFEPDENDDTPEENLEIDITALISKFSSSNSSASLSSDQSTHRERVIMEIIKYLNTPYKFGGNSMKGIDCSAFTQTVFRDALAINIHRSAREQYTQGEVISDKDELKFGDLVFFNTRRRVRPGHVGIYIGDNLFAHASTKLGVTITPLDHNYYSARYMGARRVESNGLF